MRYWNKKTGLVPAVAAFAVILSGCDLEVLNPGAIQDADLFDPSLMPILVNGVSAEYNDFQDDHAFDIARLTDELAGTGSYSTTQEYRQGFFDDQDSEGNWAQIHEARWSADQALTRLAEVSINEDAYDYSSDPNAARAWMLKGHANVRLGENFCYAVYGGGVGDTGDLQPRTASFDSAQAAFDSAIAIATSAGADSDQWRISALAGKAAAEAGKASFGAGSWATASTLAQAAIDAMPDEDWVDQAIYNAQADQNNMWTETWGRAEMGAFRTLAQELWDNEMDPRVEYKECGEWNGTEADDPRTMTKTELDALIAAGVTPTGNCDGEGSGAHQGADGQHAHYKPMKFTERGSDMTRTSWDEMKLIQAEAAMVASDFPTFKARIDEVRAKYGLPAITLPTEVGTLDYPHDLSSTQAIDVLDRERYASLWMEGRRLYDMDRWNHPFLQGGDNSLGAGLGNWVVGGSAFTPRAACMPLPRSECLLNTNVQGTDGCQG